MSKESLLKRPPSLGLASKDSSLKRPPFSGLASKGLPSLSNSLPLNGFFLVLKALNAVEGHANYVRVVWRGWDCMAIVSYLVYLTRKDASNKRRTHKSKIKINLPSGIDSTTDYYYAYGIAHCKTK